MYELFTMAARYGLMIGFGFMLQKGYVDSSMQEPFIGLGLAAFAILWKVSETKGWFSKEK